MWHKDVCSFSNASLFLSLLFTLSPPVSHEQNQSYPPVKSSRQHNINTQTSATDKCWILCCDILYETTPDYVWLSEYVCRCVCVCVMILWSTWVCTLTGWSSVWWRHRLTLITQLTKSASDCTRFNWTLCILHLYKPVLNSWSYFCISW